MSESGERTGPTRTVPLILPARFSTPRHVHDARLILRIVEAASILLIVLLVALAGVWRAEGGNFFTIRTASMGTAAPVGSLVIDRPLGKRVHIGEMISFNPPGTTEVFTHRIFRVQRDGLIRTKGDANGSPDGWLLPRGAIIGRVALTIRYVGWLVQALPIIIIGALLVWMFARQVVTPDCRITVRACGMLIVAVAVLMSTHALLNATVISFSREHSSIGGAGGTVIGTGLLPVDVHAIGGTAKTVTDGQVAEVWTGWRNSHGEYSLHMTPDWAVWWIAPLVLLSMIPALIALSLPRRVRDDEILLTMVAPAVREALNLRATVDAPAVRIRGGTRSTASDGVTIPPLRLDGQVSDSHTSPHSRSAAASLAGLWAAIAVINHRRLSRRS